MEKYTIYVEKEETVNNKTNKKDKKKKGYKTNPKYIETKNRRVQLLVQPSIIKQIKDIANKRGTSMNETIIQAMIEFIDKYKV